MKITATTLSQDDLPSRVSWINDPRVNQHMYFNLPASLEDTRKWFNQIKKQSNRLDLVLKCPEGRPLAMAGLMAINETYCNAEFYIFIKPDMQGKGMGTSITSWVLHYAFFTMGLERIYLYADPENQIGVRLYEKLGFTKEGVLRQHRKKNGQYVDKLVYGILAEEWKNSPNARQKTPVEITSALSETNE